MWLLAPLVCVEGLVRTLHLAPPTDPNPNIWQPHPTLGWVHAPGSGGLFLSPYREYATDVRINPLGLRDRPIAYEKPPDTVRLLSLGDSFGEAVQVDLDATYPKQLESLLARSLGRRVEVLNAAVGGWGTDQELDFYLDEGWRYAPDVVLLGFFVGNDLVNNYAPLQLAEAWGGADKPFYDLSVDGTLVGPARAKSPAPSSSAAPPVRPPPWLADVAATLWQHAATYRLAAPHLRDVPFVLRWLGPSGLLGADGVVRAAFPPIPTVYLSYETPPDERFEAAWRLTATLILRLRDETARRGARLVVVIVCAREQIDQSVWARTLEAYPAMQRRQWDLEWQNRRLATFLTGAGIPYVDLLPEFHEAAAEGRGSAPLYFRHDGHWTPAGHRLAAAALQQTLAPFLRSDVTGQLR